MRGAREHNLQRLDLRLPRERLVALTGPSGSGKTSLAVDTLYAEGQRRYVQSLGPAARRYLDQVPKPAVDGIDGLSPAICVRQELPRRSPRSTVGTTTGVHQDLARLMTSFGVARCPTCGEQARAYTVDVMVDRLMSEPDGTRSSILAPLDPPLASGEARTAPWPREALVAQLVRLRGEGFVRVRLDGATRDLAEVAALAEEDPRRLGVVHAVDVYIDRLVVKEGARGRAAEAIELAAALTGGVVRVLLADGRSYDMSERLTCPSRHVLLPDPSPKLFSSSDPLGACARCGGAGEVRRVSAALAIPDTALSLRAGAVLAWGKVGGAFYRHMLAEVDEALPGLLDRPIDALAAATRERLVHGEPPPGFEGIVPGIERRMGDQLERKRAGGGDEEALFDFLDAHYGAFTVTERCPSCDGRRLSEAATAFYFGGMHLPEMESLPVEALSRRLDAVTPEAPHAELAKRLAGETVARLRTLEQLGVGYLPLDRALSTLSTGEAQRVRLATRIGAGLSGVLYVLDEPSLGLHPRDVGGLVDTLLALRDRGSTVLVVEHDAAILRAADHLVDFGPGAGRLGGRVVAEGTPQAVMRDANSTTGAFLSGRRAVAVPAQRRPTGGPALVVRGARLHNLRGVDARFPCAALTCVTGPSGSGKSSLVMETLAPLARAATSPRGAGAGEVAATGLEGAGGLTRVVAVDAAPIGRTPRSSPASYMGMAEPIRDLFASLPEARARGYAAARFSYNKKGGRCETCQGDGVVKVPMYLMPDVYAPCEACGGARFARETLEVRYRGYTIADIFAMEVDAALELFAPIPSIADKLDALHAVGLGYLELGRSAMTLSGGEAQRVKLARELARRGTGQTLYVLDEPTTGLHFVDVELLVDLLQRLVERGDTVVAVDHRVDLVKVADHVIDLGPGGGDAGGQIVAEGTPEQIARHPDAPTGPYVARALSPRG
ncbi:MAG: excinuclease ABC subunit UvrA [Myxococcales bacterium]|nr:excinuclease ABC subunit UvrA [Myxococcales bacterium]